MTAPVRGENELAAALTALGYVAGLVADGGRDTFADSSDRRLALTYCWVNIGSQLKQFARKTKLSRHSVEPLSKPIKMRDKLSYGPMPDLRGDVVWDTSVNDGPQLRRIVAELADAVRAGATETQ